MIHTSGVYYTVIFKSDLSPKLVVRHNNNQKHNKPRIESWVADSYERRATNYEVSRQFGLSYKLSYGIMKHDSQVLIQIDRFGHRYNRPVHELKMEFENHEKIRYEYMFVNIGMLRGTELKELLISNRIDSQDIRKITNFFGPIVFDFTGHEDYLDQRLGPIRKTLRHLKN